MEIKRRLPEGTVHDCDHGSQNRLAILLLHAARVYLRSPDVLKPPHINVLCMDQDRVA